MVMSLLFIINKYCLLTFVIQHNLIKIVHFYFFSYFLFCCMTIAYNF